MYGYFDGQFEIVDCYLRLLAIDDAKYNILTLFLQLVWFWFA